MKGARSNTGTATTATADSAPPAGYVGRFAPSPSGALHVGSLYTAAASYLDARAQGGRWLLRVEDIDQPRVVPGATEDLLRTLEGFGFEWDDPPVRQSERLDSYEAALERLRGRGATFPCSCSRAQLGVPVGDDTRYSGACRLGPLHPDRPTGVRLRVEPRHFQFTDRIQGIFRQDVAAAVGDFVLKRRDGFHAYVLAAVLDDAAQGVTHVVRGADLLDHTPRQMTLQSALGLGTPRYAHLPVLTEPGGGKLAKSARSTRVEGARTLSVLASVFELLGLDPPRDLAQGTLPEAWRWAIGIWRIEAVPRRLVLPITAQIGKNLRVFPQE